MEQFGLDSVICGWTGLDKGVDKNVQNEIKGLSKERTKGGQVPTDWTDRTHSNVLSTCPLVR